MFKKKEGAVLLPHQHPILQRAIKHFDPENMQYTDIPDWPDEDGKPTRIHYMPYTLRDRAWVASKVSLNGDGVTVFADLIIRKAIDENGNKQFALAHRDLLLDQVDPNVLEALAGMMTRARSVSDHLKNLKAIPQDG